MQLISKCLCTREQKVPTILIGAKLDLGEAVLDNILLSTRARDYCLHNDLFHAKVSAKTGENMRDLLVKLGELLLQYHQATNPSRDFELYVRQESMFSAREQAELLRDNRSSRATTPPSDSCCG